MIQFFSGVVGFAYMVLLGFLFSGILSALRSDNYSWALLFMVFAAIVLFVTAAALFAARDMQRKGK